MRSAAFFCTVCAALFACFFPQFGQLLTQLRELQFVGGAKIGDALFTVSLSRPMSVRAASRSTVIMARSARRELI